MKLSLLACFNIISFSLPTILVLIIIFMPSIRTYSIWEITYVFIINPIIIAIYFYLILQILLIQKEKKIYSLDKFSQDIKNEFTGNE